MIREVEEGAALVSFGQISGRRDLLRYRKDSGSSIVPMPKSIECRSSKEKLHGIPSTMHSLLSKSVAHNIYR
jgi:hypothetical protein